MGKSPLFNLTADAIWGHWQQSQHLQGIFSPKEQLDFLKNIPNFDVTKSDIYRRLQERINDDRNNKKA